jgi:hypothetical protein
MATPMDVMDVDGMSKIAKLVRSDVARFSRGSASLVASCIQHQVRSFIVFLVSHMFNFVSAVKNLAAIKLLNEDRTSLFRTGFPCLGPAMTLLSVVHRQNFELNHPSLNTSAYCYPRVSGRHTPQPLGEYLHSTILPALLLPRI